MDISGTFNFCFDGGDAYQLSATELAAIRERAFGKLGLASRVSLLFCASMVAHELSYGLGRAIGQAVVDLETGENTAATKAPAPFKRPPLIGLWHKHFTDARFLPGNYLAAIPKSRRFEVAMDAFQSSEGMHDDQRAEYIVRRTYIEPFEERFAEGRATGEWVVFLPHEGRNYYLTCCKHRVSAEEQSAMLEDIQIMCGIEFPDLPL